MHLLLGAQPPVRETANTNFANVEGLNEVMNAQEKEKGMDVKGLNQLFIYEGVSESFRTES
jgi:hypothetical protein